MALAALGAAASVAGGLLASRGQRDAARTQARAADQAGQIQWDMFEQSREDMQPWRRAGRQGLAALQSELGLGPRPEGYGGFEGSPGYQFRLGEGMRALEGSLAARGQRNSGAAQRAITQYAQGVASDEFGTNFNRLAALAGIGQTATQGIAGLGAGAAANAGNALMAAGGARASGYTGAFNALSEGVGDAASFIGYGLGRRGQAPGPMPMPTPQSFGLSAATQGFRPSPDFGPGRVY